METKVREPSDSRGGTWPGELVMRNSGEEFCPPPVSRVMGRGHVCDNSVLLDKIPGFWEDWEDVGCVLGHSRFMTNREFKSWIFQDSRLVSYLLMLL